MISRLTAPPGLVPGGARACETLPAQRSHVQ